MAKKAKVLVVDDMLQNITLLKDIIEEDEETFEVFMALTGQECLDILIKETIDVVLLDWMMPKMDGLEVLKRIRNDEKSKNIPVIMVTAKARKEEIVTGLNAGANDYVTKPIHEHELMARVNAMLRIKRAEDSLLFLNRHLEEKGNQLAEDLLDSRLKIARTSIQKEILNGVLHDVNNPLASISMLSEVAALRDELDEGEKKRWKNVWECSQRIKNILADMLRIGREGTFVVSSNFPLNDAVESAIKLTQYNFEENEVAIEFEHPAETIYIHGVRGDLERALINLLVNALHAVTLRKNMFEFESTEFTGAVKVSLLRLGGTATLALQDNGCGISHENIEKIWDPYFTTKNTMDSLDAINPEENNVVFGTGLGMALIQKTIEDLQGTISVLSQVNEKTVFTINIPAIQDV